MHTFTWHLVLRKQHCFFQHCRHTFKAEVTELHMKLWPSAVIPWPSSMEQADSNPKEQVSPTMFFADMVVLQPAGT